MNGVEIIKKEREKQITKYGYDAKHDLGYQDKQLLRAALAYLLDAINGNEDSMDQWPWDIMYFKPDSYEECLAKVGAFVAAELDRIQEEVI